MNVNGVDYVKVEDVERTITSSAIGKNVIVRSRNEGINVGTVVFADERGIELKNCRRLWYHKPTNKNVSWYEGVSQYGISEDSKVSCTVETKIIIEDYSITFFENKNAYNTVMELKPHEQS